MTQPRRLVIVESPAKAAKIGSYLGNDYIVKASRGHIRDLPGKAAEVPAKYKGEKWASTGVKDKLYSDVKYIDELIWPQTVKRFQMALFIAVLAYGAYYLLTMERLTKMLLLGVLGGLGGLFLRSMPLTVMAPSARFNR